MNKTCREMGYKEGEKFRVIYDDGALVNIGDILTLVRDDGSINPWFTGSTRYPFSPAGNICCRLNILERIETDENEPTRNVSTRSYVSFYIDGETYYVIEHLVNDFISARPFERKMLADFIVDIKTDTFTKCRYPLVDLLSVAFECKKGELPNG